jgi:kinesin family protein 5
LGRVINNLTDGKSTHIPYRESKLTRVLQESLGGNSKTCLIITCSPSIYNESESLSTLRFGERAKKIKNKPKINKEITVAELQKLVTQLKENLKKADARISQLENYIRQNGLSVPASDYKKEEDEEEKRKREEKEEKEKSKNEEKEINDLKLKISKENIPLGDRIANALNILENDDEYSYDNRIELLANLKYIKEVVESKDFNNNNNSKNNTTRDTATSENNNSGGSTQGKCLDIISKIRDSKEVKDNPALMKLVQGLQMNVNQLGVGSDSDDSLKKEDKNIQTEKLEEEYDKINEKFEREKRVLYKQIEDKTLIINNLSKDIEQLKERNKMMEDKIPFNEKKAFDMNMILESNLRDLRFFQFFSQIS